MAKLITAAIAAHASVLLARSERWARGIDKSRNIAFVAFSSSRLGSDGTPVYYRTACDGSGCTCPGFYHRGVCCHAVACRIEAERAREMITRRAGPAYDELMSGQLVDAF